MKKIVYLFLVFCCIFMCACGGNVADKDMNETESEKVNSDLNKNGKEDIEINKEITEEAVDADGSKSEAGDEITEEKEAQSEPVYEYTIWIGSKKGLGLNVPEGYFYNAEKSSNARMTVGASANDEIEVTGGSEQIQAWFSHYKDTGEWNDDLWNILVESSEEVDTEYGTVLIVSGVSEINKNHYELGLFEYDDKPVYIQRRTDGNGENIKKILNDMFSAKEQTENENIKEQIQTVEIDLANTNYTYYLSQNEYVIVDKSYEHQSVKIFGFDIPEGYTESTSSTSYPEGMPELEAYSMIGFWNSNTGEGIDIGFAEELYYLKNFISSDVYSSGEEIMDIAYGVYTLDTLEKGGIVKSVYGDSRVIYQTATSTNGKVVKTEIALFHVNNYDVVISYKYPDDETSTFEGKLETILPEMLGQ